MPAPFRSPFPPRIRFSVALGWGVVALVAGAAAMVAARRPRTGLLLAAAAHGIFSTTAAIPNHPLTGPLVRRFRPVGREVWLTIDDGPHPDSTPEILEILRRHAARATFFVIGSQAAQFPDLIRAIVEAGHSLGNHTHGHASATFWTAGPRRIAREIDAATEAVVAAGLPAPRYFRAPVGLTNLLVAPALATRRLLRIGWSARAFDTRPQEPSAVVERIMRSCEPGAIILVHERGAAAGPRSLGPLLARLEAEAYRCVLPPDESLIIEGGQP